MTKTMRKDSRLYRLISLLSVCGEYPVRSLHLLGNKRMYRKLVDECMQPLTVRNPETAEAISLPRLFNLCGKGRLKSIRLYSGALPILKWIDEGEYYDIISNGHNMPMNDQHLDRNHRVAEVLAVCRDAGIEIFPHNLPNFQRDEFDTIIPIRQPFFMTSRMLKWFGGDDAANKTNFTRLVGTLFIGETDYFVYNTRYTPMKWSGLGELKAKINIRTLLQKPPFHEAYSMLFADSGEIAMDAYLATHKIKNSNYHFDKIYDKTHFIPLNEYGARFLRFFTIPNWHDMLIKNIFQTDTLTPFVGNHFDNCTDNIYSLVWLNGDLRRLWAAYPTVHKTRIYCFCWQERFVRNYVGDDVEILIVNFNKVESLLFDEYEEDDEY